MFDGTQRSRCFMCPYSANDSRLLDKHINCATLWALVCTAEALNMLGITDPYKLYKYFRLSDVSTCVGSGMGGTEVWRICSKTVARRKTSKTISCRRRQSTLPLEDEHN
jgi:3-oxoacyl-(acyl-carrier-protein) synthase